MQGKCKRALRQACSSNHLNVPVNWWWNKFKDPSSSSKMKKEKKKKKEEEMSRYIIRYILMSRYIIRYILDGTSYLDL